MTPNQFWKTYFHNDRARIQRICKKAGTSVANFQQIALANGAVGRVLAKKLSIASGGEMSILEILYPEDYQKQRRKKA